MVIKRTIEVFAKNWDTLRDFKRKILKRLADHEMEAFVYENLKKGNNVLLSNNEKSIDACKIKEEQLLYVREGQVPRRRQ